MAKQLSVPATVVVFNQQGKPETHTRANARDLINGAGYTWEKKKPTTPASYAPFALPQNTKFAKSKAQEILDRVGAQVPGDSGNDAEEVFDTVIDEGAGIVTPPDDEGDGEAFGEIEDATPMTPAPRPPRKRRAQTEAE